MRESPYRILEEALRPHLGARAQVVLEEGLKRLGKRPDRQTSAQQLGFDRLHGEHPVMKQRGQQRC